MFSGPILVTMHLMFTYFYYSQCDFQDQSDPFVLSVSTMELRSVRSVRSVPPHSHFHLYFRIFFFFSDFYFPLAYVAFEKGHLDPVPPR